MKTKQEETKTKIIACLASGMNHTEIARTVGCSTKTVQRTVNSLEPETREFTDGLAEYQRLFRDQLPIPKRVEIYNKIAQKAESNPFAAMRALERIDDLEGILTAKDEARRPTQDSGETRPMFILPAGTHINVTVNPIESEKPEEIDVTPKGNSEDMPS
jgi:hypothetical protein